MSEAPDTGSGGAHGDAEVLDATKAEEAREAGAPHTADRPPTPDEEREAEGNRLDPDVSEHEREMGKIGAEVEGEGEIE